MSRPNRTCGGAAVERGGLEVALMASGFPPDRFSAYRTATTSSPSSRDGLPKSSVSPSCSRWTISTCFSVPIPKRTTVRVTRLPSSALEPARKRAEELEAQFALERDRGRFIARR